MSTATKYLHRPSELALVGGDDRTGIVVFEAPSAHDAARVNTVSLDTQTGETLCDCRGAEFGRRCWHMDWVAAAWRRTAPMVAARALTDDALLALGRKARRMVDAYRARCGRALPDDALALVAARSEWRHRAALRLARAVVAEHEALPHSDRAIDAGRGGLTAYHVAKDTLAALDLPLSA